MRKTFAVLDDALIERIFQPASDTVSNRTGLSRTTAACFCADAASLAWIISRARGLSGAVLAWEFSSASLDLVLLLLGLAALISLHALFRQAVTENQANPLRPAMQPHRAVALLMLVSRLAQFHVLDLVTAADLTMLLCATVSLYLGACIERPRTRARRPSAGRMRAMLY